jgi:hypothetical protein
MEKLSAFIGDASGDEPHLAAAGVAPRRTAVSARPVPSTSLIDRAQQRQSGR